MNPWTQPATNVQVGEGGEMVWNIFGCGNINQSTLKYIAYLRIAADHVHCFTFYVLQ